MTRLSGQIITASRYAFHVATIVDSCTSCTVKIWPSVTENSVERKLTNFCAPFFKEFPSFFCGMAPSKTLAAPQPLNIAFPLGNGEVLRSEEGEGFRKEGDGGEGEKKEKRTRKKCSGNEGGWVLT